MNIKKECPYCHSTNTRPNGSRGNNSIDDIHYGMPWYICNDCESAGRSPFNFPEYHIRKPKPKIEYTAFDRIIAFRLFNEVVQISKYKEDINVNAYTNTVVSAEHIADILGIEYKVVNDWVHEMHLLKEYDEQALIEYIKTQENVVLILNLLGYIKTPMNLTYIPFILTKKPRASKKTGQPIYSDEWDLHREKTDKIKWFRGILAKQVSIVEFTCREDAIVVLGAILRCQYSELRNTTYKDFANDKKTIKFQTRTYILHRREKDIAKWLKDRAAPNNDYLCVDDKGQFISEDKINEYLSSLCQQVNIESVRLCDFCKDVTSPSNS